MRDVRDGKSRRDDRTRLLLAICAALVGVPSAASADSGLAPRLRLQGGYTHLDRQQPEHDGWGGAIPQLAFYVNEPRTLLHLTYSFAFTVHSALPTEIANRLELASTYDVSPATLLLLTASATQSSITQSFINQPASETQFGAVPPARTQLASFMLSEATSTEASPLVRVDQQVEARFVTPFDVPSPTRNYLVNAAVSVERTFEKDAIGGLLRGSYAYSSVPNERDPTILAGSLAPRWRHDISRALTSSVAAGASVVTSPDPDTRVLVRPFGYGSLVLEEGDATFELAYTGGPQTNVVTAQIFDAQQATFRIATPLSVRDSIDLGASAGYLHGEPIDLRRDVPSPPTIDAILADAGLSWAPAEWMQFFLRYTFFDQWGGAAGSVVRNAVFGGIQLSSREGGVRVTNVLPRRVDRSDQRESRPKE